MDKPLLHYAVEEALHSGIEEFIFIIRKEKNSIQSYFQQFPGLISQKSMHYVYQENPLGLGHAISCARDFINDEFFSILLPDELILAQTPCLKQMIEVYQAVHTNVLAIHSVSHEEVSQYGIIKGEETSTPFVLKLEELVEKPSIEKAPSSLAIVGRYILSSRIFHYLENQQPGANGEIQLTDSLHSLLKKEPFYGLKFL
jgi:UTP--glucose-1-phosphate uridylyltransferase